MEYLGTKASGSDLSDQDDNSNLTTKGDLEAYSTVATRLPVGTDGQVLTADSAEATGLKWATSAGGGTVTTSGTPIATDFARFTTATEIEGRSPTETISDLGIDADITTLTIGASATVTGSNTGDSQTLANGVSDVTATASEVNLLDLSGLTAGWALLADTATTASWQALPAKPTLSKSITLVDPVATDDMTGFFTPVAITVTDVRSHITGTTNVVFNVSHAATRTGTALDVFTSDITLTSTAGQSNSTGFNDATIPANSWVWLDVVSVSGTPTMFHATIIYTED